MGGKVKSWERNQSEGNLATFKHMLRYGTVPIKEKKEGKESKAAMILLLCAGR